jgi:hypothetical protein
MDVDHIGAKDELKRGAAQLQPGGIGVAVVARGAYRRTFHMDEY